MTAMLFAGCGNQVADEPEPEGAAAENEPEAEATTKVITDMAGSEVEITTNVQRVVNLWPASNSAMLCMGAGDKLVGTMDGFTKSLPWSQFVAGIVDVPGNR